MRQSGVLETRLGFLVATAAIVVLAGGTLLAWLLWPAPRDRIQGRLLLGGEPVTRLASIDPVFLIRNEETRTVPSGARITHSAGRFEIRGLPLGRYALLVQVDLDRTNPPGFPGDLWAFTPFTVSPTRAADLVIDLHQVIHLTSPENNAKPIGRGAGDLQRIPAFQAPVLFQWKPLGDGVAYDYRVMRVAPPSRELGVEAHLSTLKAEALVPLLPSSDDEFYVFQLGARRAGRHVGLLLTQGARGFDADYRFRVVPGVTGRVHGQPFRMDRTEIDTIGVLTLREGPDFFADREIRVSLRLDQDKIPVARSFKSGDPSGSDVVSVILTSRHGGKATMKMWDSSTFDLAFGQLKGDRLPGRVTLRVPDEHESHAEGSFVAVVTGHEGTLEVDVRDDSFDVLKYLIRRHLEHSNPGVKVEIVEFGTGMLGGGPQERRQSHMVATFLLGGGQPQARRFEFRKTEEGWHVTRTTEP